ncbi:TPA: homoserine dehydrogenase [Candidatus Bathyarchaeota archaeon]|nr:homoserine dehydrogenase [Candidatus Bathyarchaeota archaeon]
MKLTIIGFGTVGKALMNLLMERRRELVREFGLRPEVVAVVDRGGALINPEGLDPKLAFEADRKGTVASHEKYGQPGLRAIKVIEEVESDVVVELTPTNVKDGQPGLSHIEAALKAGRHVVTTNKGPLALALPALMELAAYNGVFLRFSGSVGGGTPILNLAKRCLAGEKILFVKGILNGTTNYILTRMYEEGLSMEVALKEAKKLGYAEADPSYDIEGIDAACKLVIIANWVMGEKISIKDVKKEGISKIQLEDVAKAKKRRRTIKLIAFADDEAYVKPVEIPIEDPLCVGGTLNAVTFKAESSGEITLIGRGAGGKETASAVLRDLIDIKLNLLRRTKETW